MKVSTEAIISWGSNQAEIRALILTGSRVIEGQSDDLSDYDIAVFLGDDSRFTSRDDWLSEIGIPWVCVHEKIDWKGRDIPTRLVIFDPGVKIDFAFYPIKVLEELAHNSLPNEFAAGYRILVDKDEIATKMNAPSSDCYQEGPPTEEEFLRVVEEFWFEVYHVAKYLARGDLWSAKFRDAGIKQEFLLRMIRWHTQAKHNWKHTTHTQGKRMQEWVDSETWNEVSCCSSGFNEEESSEALTRMMELFRRLAKESAESLSYPYLQKLDDNISIFVDSCLTKGGHDGP